MSGNILSHASVNKPYTPRHCFKNHSTDASATLKKPYRNCFHCMTPHPRLDRDYLPLLSPTIAPITTGSPNNSACEFPALSHVLGSPMTGSSPEMLPQPTRK